MKILSWNIRSLAKHFDEVSIILRDSDIDIINFNESWLGKDNPNSLYRLENYKIYRNDRANRKKGGGLCTYVHCSLKCNAQTYQALNMSNEHLECLILDIELPQTKPIIIISVYRPPSGKVADAIELLQNIYM